MKNCLYAFNGELMCFVHVLLNALDMKERGFEVIIVFEGASVKLIPELEKEENPFHKLYKKAKDAGLFYGVCKACAVKMGVAESVDEAGLPQIGTISGHPSMAEFQEQGYTIITF